MSFEVKLATFLTSLAAMIFLFAFLMASGLWFIGIPLFLGSIFGAVIAATKLIESD